jgi:hypothetical protein
VVPADIGTLGLSEGEVAGFARLSQVWNLLPVFLCDLLGIVLRIDGCSDSSVLILKTMRLFEETRNGDSAIVATESRRNMMREP